MSSSTSPEKAWIRCRAEFKFALTRACNAAISSIFITVNAVQNTIISQVLCIVPDVKARVS